MTIRVLAIGRTSRDFEILKSTLDSIAEIRVSEFTCDQAAVSHFRSQGADLLLFIPDSTSNSGPTLRRVVEQTHGGLPILVLHDHDHDLLALAEMRALGAQDCLPLSEFDGPQLFRAIRGAVERESLLQELKTVSCRDPLTGLANRSAILAQIERRLRTQSSFTLLFIDVDDFKLVNDCHGHNLGDQFLFEFAQRIQSTLAPSDSMGRFGGDEFVVILDGSLDDTSVQEWIAQAMMQLRRPIFIQENELYAKFSAGVCNTTQGINADRLLQEVDTAMYVAKGRGKCRYVWYDSQMQTDAMERLGLERALWHALENDEISIHYQPQVDLATGRTLGFEALARWVHQQTPISPLKFIPMAERTGLIHEIGLWILESACKQLKQWSSQTPDLRLSVNVSPVQLEREDFADRVLNILADLDVAPGQLTIEVTESGAIKDLARVADMLKKLLQCGVKVSVDDFGTGHSSLSLLHRLPVSELKVDRSFVESIEDETDYSRLFVQTIQILADGIGLEVVAEGIENIGQQSVLQALGYRIGQGYLFSRPLPAVEATAYLNSGFQQAVLPSVG
ncbi:MAG: bifunctional diguanylate cyclase/phosphodiesterase [Pirellulaceae bacterium]